DLQPPTEPELREAVEKNDQRPLTRLHVMQALIIDLGIAFPKFDPDVRKGAVVHEDLRVLGDWGASLYVRVWISNNVDRWLALLLRARGAASQATAPGQPDPGERGPSSSRSRSMAGAT